MPPDTPKAELEAVLSRLDAHKAEWAALPLPEKAACFRACMQTAIEVCRAPSVSRHPVVRSLEQHSNISTSSA